MSKHTHTPTPWAIGKMPSVYDCHQRGDFVTINSDDWFRAKACVNAFHAPDREIATEQITPSLFWELADSLSNLTAHVMNVGSFSVKGHHSVDLARALLIKLEPQK